MRAKAAFLVLLFFSSLFAGFVQGETPDDIVIDGDYTDWSADSFMGSDSNGIEAGGIMSGVDFSESTWTVALAETFEPLVRRLLDSSDADNDMIIFVLELLIVVCMAAEHGAAPQDAKKFAPAAVQRLRT